MWRNGIGAMPFIDSLEERLGSKWRPSKEKQFFSSRKAVIDEVVRRACSQNLPENVVAEQLDGAYSSVDKVFKAARSQGAISLACSDVLSRRSRHIEVRHHVLRDWVSQNAVQLKYIPSEDNIADAFTKPLPIPAHLSFLSRLNMS